MDIQSITDQAVAVHGAMEADGVIVIVFKGKEFGIAHSNAANKDGQNNLARLARAIALSIGDIDTLQPIIRWFQ